MHDVSMAYGGFGGGSVPGWSCELFSGGAKARRWGPPNFITCGERNVYKIAMVSMTRYEK
eukprot:1157021-Pelagomonas_calceolata.AAC.10